MHICTIFGLFQQAGYLSRWINQHERESPGVGREGRGARARASKKRGRMTTTIRERKEKTMKEVYVLLYML
jgi:hypothetical protein